jgi:hypothetical protein
VRKEIEILHLYSAHMMPVQRYRRRLLKGGNADMRPATTLQALPKLSDDINAPPLSLLIAAFTRHHVEIDVEVCRVS